MAGFPPPLACGHFPRERDLVSFFRSKGQKEPVLYHGGAGVPHHSGAPLCALSQRRGQLDEEPGAAIHVRVSGQGHGQVGSYDLESSER